MCHINMLKCYHPRGDMQPERRSAPPVVAVGAAVPAAVSSGPTLTVSDDDGLNGHKVQQQTPQLSNSEMLLNLPSLMPHLSRSRKLTWWGSFIIFLVYLEMFQLALLFCNMTM